MAASNPELDAVDIALRVARAVEACEGAYFVGGSLASSFQGEPRATNDIDVVVELPLGRIDGFVNELGSDFEVDVGMLRETLLHGGCCNVFFLPTVMKVDIFALGPSAYDHMEFARRRRVQVRGSGEVLVLKSPEDTVLRKLLWYRDGGGVSDRQWRDIVEVLRVSGAALDDGYLDAWASRLNLGELLRRARGESAPRNP